MEYTDTFLLVPAEQYSALLESAQKAAVVPQERVEEPVEVDSDNGASNFPLRHTRLKSEVTPAKS